MNALVRRLNFLSWPLWVKLTIGFAIAILVPVILILGIGWSGISQVGLENVRTYILETGTRQRQAVADMFNLELTRLKSFTQNLNYRSAVLSVLQEGNTTVETVSKVLRQGLMDVTSPYDTVWLLDSDGIVIAAVSRLQQSEAGVLGIRPGQDESRSPVFQTGANLGVLDKDQALAVYSGGSRPVIALVTALKSTNETLGYLAASLDLEDAIYSNLQLQRGTLPAYSFLVGRNGQVIAPPEALALIGDAASSSAVGRAFGGERGVDAYTSSSGQEVVGYYSPLNVQGQSTVDFVLITEIPQDIVANQVVDFFSLLSFPLLTGTLALLVVLSLLFTQLFAPPLNQLLSAIRAMAGGNYEAPLPAAGRGDEFGKVAASFADMRQQVQRLIADLMQQMEERVRDIQTTHEISRFAASQRDLQTLIDRVVDLIVERFSDIYHAQIFLIDAERRYAVLRASTGEPGRKLLARGHRLGVGSLSVVGRAAQEGRVVIARDTDVSDIHRRNELLPDTRAEVAIPLMVGDIVIGALDVQSRRSGGFSENEVSVLQTMSAQIAVAIQNALLYQESLRRLEEIESANRQATLRAWSEYMAAERARELTTAAGTETGVDMSDLRQMALAQGRTIVGKLTERRTIPVAVPIRLRGQTLGAVEWELPAEDFSSNKVQLAQDLVSRLAVSLENARLFQESLRATERERLVNAIAAQLTQQTDINAILQTAVREVGQALRAPQVTIRLHWAEGEPDGSTNGHGERE